uniref:Abnormal spindle microtubule assembly n=1 Tax=Neogobius melanostomus TaxID=47308 RepID=A0A8C6UT50_9GOBI
MLMKQVGLSSRPANFENDVPVLTLIQFSKAPFVTFGTVKTGTSKSAVLRLDNPTEDVEAEVVVEKIASSKGFSVDHNTFTIEVSLTWTPTEEGGVRELLVFNANGVVKHQAVLLGRAEAPKKKKKSLWDSIKNKPGMATMSGPRVKRSEPTLKMAANKTFQVPRKAHYKRVKPRSPLASLIQDRFNRESPLSPEYRPRDEQRILVSAVQDMQENFPLVRRLSDKTATTRNSLVLLCVYFFWPTCAYYIIKPVVIFKGAPSVKSSAQKSKMVAVAQSKLTFMKPAQTAIPRHPMPFAAKNMFFDERWIEKQERGFTWWINYVLTPDDFKVNTEVAKVNALSLAMGSEVSVPKAPTKEEMSFSTYTARRKLNRLRRAACQLFTSEPMVKAIQKLEVEVEAKRLLVRKDRHLWKDIGERQKVLNWILSYNPLWLRIGLETIYGELISLENNGDTFGLAMFILQRLLWNPDIAAEYRHAKVPNLYRDGHEEALSRFTLKKLLLLVCFLDKAKESRLIEHDPCLFCMDAEFKMSKDLLLAFSRDFLSGEGILPRHLGYLGLPVSHQQKPLDEFNFAVKNLAVDLKCGVRLVRVMELLVQDWSLSVKLRLPAISRLQKVHNVDIALQVLKKKSVDLKDEHGSVIDSRDIVDGHREKTLSLLWKIMFAFHVILNEDLLTEEIGFLRKTFRTKRRLAYLRTDRGLQPSPAKDQASFEHSSPRIQLLMDWVRAVCDFYSIKVENFTVSFSDGRVLCYLIHHYHPSLVPGKDICQSTTQTVESSPRGRLQLDCSTSDSDCSFDSVPSDSPLKELLDNEKSNFRLVNRAVAFLGGVPAMINAADMSNTIPNEKVVMSYLSFLCTRLLDLRNETRAARVIQAAWRKYRLTKDLQLYQERNAAALKIQSLVRRFLQRRRVVRQSQAAAVIQKVWRGYVFRKEIKRRQEARLGLLRTKAATAIQVRHCSISQCNEIIQILRMYCATKSFQRLRYYSIVIQAQWRMRRAAYMYRRTLWAVSVIQLHTRAWATAKRERECFLSLRSAAVKIQRSYRCWKAQKTETENRAARVIQAAFRKWYEKKISEKHAAAVKIQAWYRKHCCLHQYRKIRRSAMLIQAHYRGYVQRQGLQILKLQHYSATVLQSAFRGYLVRIRLTKMTLAAVVIQQHLRAMLQSKADRQEFLRTRSAAITLQAAYRGRLARGLLKTQHKAATLIQAVYRRYAAQTRYHLMRKAALLIQQRYRATCIAKRSRDEYLALRNATLKIQAIWRGRVVRRILEKQNQCATIIQAWFRRLVAQRRYKSTKSSVQVIQQYFRAYKARKDMREAFLNMRAATIALQAAFRGMVVRKELKRKHEAATVLQSYARMALQRKRYNLLLSAAIVIQSRYRALVVGRNQRREFGQIKEATLRVQAVYRRYSVRRGLKRQHTAATVIQAHFRMYQIRMAYLATKCAAVIIQERYRAKRLRDQQVQTFRSMKSAALTIQAAYRGYKTRKHVREMQRAAVVIQRAFLTHRARNRFIILKSAAVVCQRWYRALTVARKQHSDYLAKREAVFRLQAACRGHLVRKELRKKHSAAIIIQCQLRKHQAQTSYKKLRWAAKVLQERFRAKQKMTVEMQALQVKRNAAVVLQAAFRGMENVRKMHRAASLMQRTYKTYCQRKQYLAVKASVVAVQRRYRATVAAKKQNKQFWTMRKAAVSIQAAYRGHQVRKEVAHRHQASTVIQAAFRKHRYKVAFQAMRLSAIIIQRHYRSWLLQRRERARFLEVKQSTVVLQAAFRGVQVRRELSRQTGAAVTIQSHWRGFVQRRQFLKNKDAVLKMQRRIRAVQLGKTQREHYDRQRRSAITLQRHWRIWITRKRVRCELYFSSGIISQANRRVRFTAAIFCHLHAIKIQRALRVHWALLSAKKQINSVITIQRWVRAWHQKRRYQEDRRKVAVVQRAVRRWLDRRQRAACVIQQAARKFLHLRRQKKIQQGIIKAQALWRGHRSRRLNDDAKVVKLRQRLRTVTAGVREEDKLCNKTTAALEYLLRYKHFSDILEALKNLETATRLSPKCCERLVESGATTTIFTLIRSCNRSIPCMDVVTLSIQILLNLSKYNKTIEAVYSVDSSVETLLDLLQRYREKAGDKVAEKGGSIFTKACFLLALLLQDKHRAVDVMRMPKAIERLQSIYRLTARKHKMDAERTVVKHKMSASLNGSFFIQATPRKTRPAFVPDWVLRKDKLKDIVDPLRAIQMVAETMSIVL